MESKKQQLREWILSRRGVRTSEVIAWGQQNYHNRAERDARDLAKAGLIERMGQEKKAKIFGDTREDVWVPVVQPKLF